MSKAVVVLSGGLDSTTCLADVASRYSKEDILCVSFDYGQKHDIELNSAAVIAGFYGVKHRVVVLTMSVFSSPISALTGEAEMPHLTYKELEESKGVSPTYVPFRNANFLSMATALGMSTFPDEEIELVAGMHAEDARGWAYPDCTPEFIGAMANAIYVGTYFKVRLNVPLQNMSKSDVIRWGTELGAPFYLTRSCYEGRAKACGKCPTCVERLASFQKLGLKDPVEYEEGVNA